jgi:hypothetical protein
MSYRQAKALGIGHLHPAATGRTDAEALRGLGVEDVIPSTHKYHAQRTEYNGRSYPSKAQANRAAELDLMVKDKQIYPYLEEVTFQLGPDFRYRADFVVVNRSRPNMWPLWAEDVKGFATPRFKTAIKMWRKYGAFPLHVIGNKSTEIVIPLIGGGV